MHLAYNAIKSYMVRSTIDSIVNLRDRKFSHITLSRFKACLITISSSDVVCKWEKVSFFLCFVSFVLQKNYVIRWCRWPCVRDFRCVCVQKGWQGKVDRINTALTVNDLMTIDHLSNLALTSCHNNYKAS